MAAKIQPIAPDVGLGSWQDSIQHGLEGTSQTWKVGAPLVVSAGFLIQATTSTGAKSGIVGFALAPASGVSGTDVPYVPPSPDCLTFQGTVDGTLSSSNAPGTGTLTQANMYTGGTLQKDAASGLWFFCNSATGDFIFTAAIGPDSPVGTVNGRVRVQFLHAICLIA
jgi:hypothetical protein